MATEGTECSIIFNRGERREIRDFSAILVFLAKPACIGRVKFRTELPVNSHQEPEQRTIVSENQVARLLRLIQGY